MTISKRNGKYYCRFQLNGERHHKLCAGATTKAEAEKIENAFKYKLQQQQNGVIPREKDKVTLNYMCDQFLNYSEINKKSFKQDKSRIKLIRKYFSKYKFLEDVLPNDIEVFKNYLLMEGKIKTTVNRYL